MLRLIILYRDEKGPFRDEVKSKKFWDDEQGRSVTERCSLLLYFEWKEYLEQ